MPALQTPLVEKGTKVHDFVLPATDGKNYSLADCMGEKGLLIMFICNHCPYVQSIISDLVADCTTLQQAGIGVVAICSNDADTYPEDSFDRMAAFAEQYGFGFPYLHDESQQIAKTYGAVCTPDFFGYNAAGEMRYRGRFDDRGRDRTSQSSRELLPAMEMVAATGNAPESQTPSIGCSIKWRDV